MKLLANSIRILLAVIFVLSGFVKAVDPIGFSYKLQEYFEVFELHQFNDFALHISIIFCFLEILLGIMLFFGISTSLTLWGYIGLLVFFGFLTFYSAYFHVVKDCGCFGDFIKFTPWQSFMKDLILLLLTISILIIRKNLLQLKNYKVIAIIISVLLLWYTYFTYQTLNHLPVIDFRPYKVGNNISELMSIPEGEKSDVYKVQYSLKNPENGEVVTIDNETYTTQEKYWQWEIQSTKEILVEKGYTPPIHDFYIIDETTDTDITSEILSHSDPVLWIIIEEITEDNKEVVEKAFEFLSKIDTNKVYPIVLTAVTRSELPSTSEEINVFNIDGITIKTIIRSNPGFVLLDNGIVLKKWHFNDMPSLQELYKIK